MAEICMTLRLTLPWWRNLFVAAVVIAARCGFAVDPNWAGRFLVNASKLEAV